MHPTRYVHVIDDDDLIVTFTELVLIVQKGDTRVEARMRETVTRCAAASPALEPAHPHPALTAPSVFRLQRR